MIAITRKPIETIYVEYEIKDDYTKDEILQRIYDRLSPVKLQLGMKLLAD